jgi:hypothetical protein
MVLRVGWAASRRASASTASKPEPVPMPPASPAPSLDARAERLASNSSCTCHVPWGSARATLAAVAAALAAVEPVGAALLSFTMAFSPAWTALAADGVTEEGFEEVFEKAASPVHASLARSPGGRYAAAAASSSSSVVSVLRSGRGCCCVCCSWGFDRDPAAAAGSCDTGAGSEAC